MWFYQVFHAFIHYYYLAPRVSGTHGVDRTTHALLQRKDYALYRQWPGLSDDPWRTSWQAGELVSMSALCLGGSPDGDQYCIRCGKYNSSNDSRDWEGGGGIEW